METTGPERAEDLAQLITWIKDTTGDNWSEIARRIDVAPATVSAWVNRKRGAGRGPNRETLKALAAAYNIPEKRVFTAVARSVPGDLTPDAEQRVLELYRELTEDQQRAKLVELQALVEHNRSGA